MCVCVCVYIYICTAFIMDSIPTRKCTLHFFFDTNTIPIIMWLYEIFSLRDFDRTYLTVGCDPDGLLISKYISTCVSELHIFLVWIVEYSA